MIIIKPKMLKGELNIEKSQSTLCAAGLILGALGSRIDIFASPEFNIYEKKKYLIKLLKESGCRVNKTECSFSALCSGLTNPLLVDATKCEGDIFLIIAFLCFLKGESKIFNLKSISSSLKDRVFLLLGNLKKIGANITVDSDEILFRGKQSLSGAEVSAYSDFDIFSALCIVAHRCEGTINLFDISGIENRQYEAFKNMLISLESEIKEKHSFLKMSKNIVLTGMSGAGKSYIGKILADTLDLKFYDSDLEFEKEENCKISDVFKESGEEYFRKRESEIIKKLSRKSGCVISTGGGVVLREENISNLKDNGIIFYLKRDIESIVNSVDASGRPLFKGGKTAIRKLFKQRKSIYEKTADYTVSNNGTSDEPINVICEIYEKCKDVLK